MKTPKMILFDYGQTLVKEACFDGVKGTQAVMAYAIENKHNLSAKQIQAEADAINNEIGRFDPDRKYSVQTEVHNAVFNAYLYESLGIKLSLSGEEYDRIFWEAAAPGVPTEGIQDFLSCLKKQNIRTGVISNIRFCGSALKARINQCIPENAFEFILATSEYLFRKPNRRIFDLALEKAGLPAKEVWYVGDQYKFDVEGARNAGMYPVWYLGTGSETGRKEEGVLIVRSWSELQGKLAELTEDAVK
ncbi:MAG: HAD family hydrolase [Lachnospiraceae bacterium]|nr:HAD family hydrolase [Lachnospiraceae bacterium]